MRWSKRGLDLLASGVGILVLAPVFALISLAIVSTAGRPVFFRQVRIGRGGEAFRIWKFRTMIPAAEQQGPQLTMAGDTRVTSIGRFLRAWKLDELPQLLNVLAGEMSLVGPRPEVPRYVSRYAPEERVVLELTPGITDPASLAYRKESELLAESEEPERTYIEQIMPAKISINLAYARQADLWSDITVILSTLTGGLFPVRWRGGPANPVDGRHTVGGG